ncbi:hypothetical protein NDU88_004538 [Pleurodeles waltl]|uniref:Uncharacterized protein n=1 Tax=Pleurodeles waltl TaxID=8319 RepID=A0AAV7RLM2_PLEWA|nr:hypothetical protein NDU88_004538 [Pleurodeles waltl]
MGRSCAFEPTSDIVVCIYCVNWEVGLIDLQEEYKESRALSRHHAGWERYGQYRALVHCRLHATKRILSSLPGPRVEIKVCQIDLWMSNRDHAINTERNIDINPVTYSLDFSAIPDWNCYSRSLEVCYYTE